LWLEILNFEGDVRTLHLLAGWILGLIFGVSAQISGFCLRQAICGQGGQRGSAIAIWLSALVCAVLGATLAHSFNLLSIETHRFVTPPLPVLAISLGGLMFGMGMILTGGCVSRLTVLLGSGNLRALFVLLVFAIFAHATIRGVLAPLRLAVGNVTLDVPLSSIFDQQVILWSILALLFVATALAILSARPKMSYVAFGCVIGLVSVGGWMATSTLLVDDFHPLPIQSASFTLPWSDSLFWVLASTSIPAGFGVGFIGGALLGSLLSATVRGKFRLMSFGSAPQTLRYFLGGALMGVGGVLAGGCTIGAGLSGIALGSISATLALVMIILGGVIATHVIERG